MRQPLVHFCRGGCGDFEIAPSDDGLCRRVRSCRAGRGGRQRRRRRLVAARDRVRQRARRPRPDRRDRPPIGSQRILPSSGPGMDVEPSWSPNGSRLAIATSDATGQDFDIATIAPNGAARKKITSGAAWDEKPAWSPDGKWIAFASDRNGNFDIYVIHPDGTGMRQLTSSTLRGHRSVVVAGRVEDRLHEPARRFPAHLDDERERLARAEAPPAAAAGRLRGHPTARASPSSTTRTATTRSTPSVPTARASPSSPRTRGSRTTARPGLPIRRCSPSRATATATATSSRCAPTAAPCACS